MLPPPLSCCLHVDRAVVAARVAEPHEESRDIKCYGKIKVCIGKRLRVREKKTERRRGEKERRSSER